MQSRTLTRVGVDVAAFAVTLAFSSFIVYIESSLWYVLSEVFGYEYRVENVDSAVLVQVGRRVIVRVALRSTEGF